MKKVTVVGMRDSVPADGGFLVNTTSRSNSWGRGLSPFLCGPVDLYDGHHSLNVENAWQYSKVYDVFVDEEENPTSRYFDWARHGWSLSRAVRYPMGVGSIPLYSYWDGQKLTYVEARIKIYCPLYSRAVERTDAWKRLKALFEKHKKISLQDFDAYLHRDLGMNYEDVLLDGSRKMGHAFVLAMMLEGERVWEKF